MWSRRLGNVIGSNTITINGNIVSFASLIGVTIFIELNLLLADLILIGLIQRSEKVGDVEWLWR